jgi:hypothetical protein
VNSVNAKVAPRMRARLIIPLPMMFPKAMFSSSFFVATKLVASSGRLVQMATTVAPTTSLEIPKLSARAVAVSTMKKLDAATPTSPASVRAMYFGSFALSGPWPASSTTVLFLVS